MLMFVRSTSCNLLAWDATNLKTKTDLFNKKWIVRWHSKRWVPGRSGRWATQSERKTDEMLLKASWAEWATVPTLRETLHVFSLHHAWLHHHHPNICEQQWCQQYKPNISHTVPTVTADCAGRHAPPPPSLRVFLRKYWLVEANKLVTIKTKFVKQNIH